MMKMDDNEYIMMLKHSAKIYRVVCKQLSYVVRPSFPFMASI